MAVNISYKCPNCGAELFWSADKKRVLNQLQRTFREKDIWQGKYYPQS